MREPKPIEMRLGENRLVRPEDRTGQSRGRTALTLAAFLAADQNLRLAVRWRALRGGQMPVGNTGPLRGSGTADSGQEVRKPAG